MNWERFIEPDDWGDDYDKWESIRERLDGCGEEQEQAARDREAEEENEQEV